MCKNGNFEVSADSARWGSVEPTCFGRRRPVSAIGRPVKHGTTHESAPPNTRIPLERHLNMSINAFNAAIAGECVLVTETRIEHLQLLGRVGDTSLVISGSRQHFSPASLNPYELVGAALGSSTAMTLRLYADRIGLPLVRIQVSVSHHPTGEESGAAFERAIILEGDLSEEQREQLLDVARHCPIDRTLTRGAEIHTSVSSNSCIAAPPATSDYLRDIEDIVGALQETPAHAE
jgi:uncharacterized OsmC-like protein